MGFLGTDRFRRVVFAVVGALAGATGLTLVVLPGSTDRFFSWGLEPAPIASLIGGLYLGSAATFAIGMATIHTSGRALCLMSLAFTLPTLVVTLVHLDVFDLDRWQGRAWVALFAATPGLFAAMLGLGAWRSVGSGPHAAPPARAFLVVLAAAAAIGAALLWIDPRGAGGWLPFAVPPLGGRFLGVWLAVIAFACAWAAFRPWEEARVTVAAAALLVGGALVAALRSFADLDAAGYVGALAVVLGALLAIRVAGATVRG
jgi:hypothetical protein